MRSVSSITRRSVLAHYRTIPVQTDRRVMLKGRISMTQEDTFTHEIDDVEIISHHNGKSRLIGFGSFKIDIHFVKERGFDVWWEVSAVRDECGVEFDGRTSDPIGKMIVDHAKSLAEVGKIKDRIELEVSQRLAPADENAEHRLGTFELLGVQ